MFPFNPSDFAFNKIGFVPVAPRLASGAALDAHKQNVA